MMQLPDAPWIRETEATGYCSSGFWNNPPMEDKEEYEKECEEVYERD